MCGDVEPMGLLGNRDCEQGFEPAIGFVPPKNMKLVGNGDARRCANDDESCVLESLRIGFARNENEARRGQVKVEVSAEVSVGMEKSCDGLLLGRRTWDSRIQSLFS